MMGIYEILFRGQLDEGQLAANLAEFLSIEERLIGPTLDFLDPPVASPGLLAGLEVLGNPGMYPIMAKLMLDEDIGDRRYLRLAEFLARKIGVDVAIGDFTYEGQDSTGQYIVLTPTGLLQQGVEGFDSHGDFVIEMESERKSVDSFLDSIPDSR